MKKTITTFFAAILIATSSFAQTGEEVLEKYITAIGGRDAIAKINDLSSKMTAEVQGMSLEIIAKKKGNKSSQVTTVVGMGEMSRSTSDGVNVSVVSQGQPAPAIEGDMLKLTLMQNAIVPEIEFLKAKVKMTVLGSEKVGDIDAVKVEMDGVAIKWVDFYDLATGLKIKNVMTSTTPMGELEMVTSFSDYKSINGVLMPMKISNKNSMFEMDITPLYEANKGIEDSEFEIK